MLGFRTLTAFILTLLTLGGWLTWRGLLPEFEHGSRPMVSGDRSAAADEDRAWALLAEATELCLPSAELLRASRTATAAVGAEALAIAGELLVRARPSTSTDVAFGVAERLRRGCVEGHRVDLPVRPAFASLDGLSPAERRSLILPYLERLNEVASRRGATATGAKPETHSAPELPAELTAERPAPEIAAAELERTVPRPAAEAGARSAPAAITIRPASRGYRKRLQSWSVVFRRETDRLGRSRRLLQASIDRRSMARSLTACRAFGIELSRLDADLLEDVPSRSLSKSLRRMVRQYRRGAAECVAGRPAAAFAYLSEGDREWRAVAGAAARMLRPRPAALPKPLTRR